MVIKMIERYLIILLSDVWVDGSYNPPSSYITVTTTTILDKTLFLVYKA